MRLLPLCFILGFLPSICFGHNILLKQWTGPWKWTGHLAPQGGYSPSNHVHFGRPDLQLTRHASLDRWRDQVGASLVDLSWSRSSFLLAVRQGLYDTRVASCPCVCFLWSPLHSWQIQLRSTSSASQQNRPQITFEWLRCNKHRLSRSNVDRCCLLRCPITEWVDRSRARRTTGPGRRTFLKPRTLILVREPHGLYSRGGGTSLKYQIKIIETKEEQL